MADKTNQNPLNEAAQRSKVIVRTSVIGILANVFLVAFKMAVGAATGSVAVIMDAVNNFSDAMSSVITIIGTKLAGRRADKKHPLGYGRVEYLSAMIVSAIVLYAGITSFIESVKAIIEPGEVSYDTVSLIIIAAAVAVKILLGIYVRRKGDEVKSASLKASGSDALFDAILSASVLASALIFVTTGISLEAYVGVLISAFIIKSGVEMIRDNLDDILGKRIHEEDTLAVKKTVCEEPEVRGAYDLIMHSYGPTMTLASLHVEVADTMTADKIDALTRRLQQKVYTEHNVILTAVGIYSQNTEEGMASLRESVYKRAYAHDGVLQCHGFYHDPETHVIRFDVIVDYDRKDRQQIFEEVVRDIQDAYPDHTFEIVRDIDF